MAKKKTETGGEETVLAAPSPTPKAGDAVTYFWPPGNEYEFLIAPRWKPEEVKSSLDILKERLAKIAGTERPATVAAVYDGTEGRLLDLNVDTGGGIVPVRKVPFRDDGAGNTWAYPEN